MRTFLEKDYNWDVLNEPYLQGLKGKKKSARPDIVLVYKNKPIFLIELKFRLKNPRLQKKDVKVLHNAVKSKKWAKKAFIIETVAFIHDKKLKKGNLVLFRNKVIRIFMKEDRIDEYKKIFL